MEIPGYTIKDKLGKGGMATVYLAVQAAFERDVALKVMDLDLIKDPQFKERFVREARIVAQLSHPHIVSVFDAGVHENLHYIAMEYHNGGDLKHRARRDISPSDAARIAKEIALGLSYAHELGYVHRDIKPDNILFDRDGHAILTDFGIAKSHNAATHLTRMGIVAGTPKYMSPEQARGKPLDGRSDIYSLGVVLYEMLTGRVPFYAEDSIALGIMHMQDPVPSLPGKIKVCQPVIERLLAKNPEERFANASEVANVLQGLEQALADIDDEQNDQTSFRPAANGAAGVKSALKPIAAAIAVLGLGFTAWLAYQNLPASNAAGNFNQLLSDAPASAVEPALGEALSDAQITEYIEKANVAVGRGRLIRPSADSAYYYYAKVLAAAPDHSEALLGVQQIASRMLTLAERSVEDHDMIEAQEYIEHVEKIAPEHPYLADSRTRLEETIEQYEVDRQANLDKRTRWRVGGLLVQAKEYIKEGNLIEPKGGSALDHYNTVLQLDPYNLDAKKGIRNIGNLFIADAVAAVKMRKLSKAELLLRSAESVVPEHPEIKLTRSAIDHVKAQEL